MSNALEDAKFRERLRLLEAAGNNPTRKELEDLDRELDQRVINASRALGNDYAFQERVGVDKPQSEDPLQPEPNPDILVERRRKPDGLWEPFAVHKVQRHAEDAVRRGKNSKYEYRIQPSDEI